MGMRFRLDGVSGPGVCSVCVCVAPFVCVCVCVMALRVAQCGLSLTPPVMCEHLRGWRQTAPKFFSLPASTLTPYPHTSPGPPSSPLDPAGASCGLVGR